MISRLCILAVPPLTANPLVLPVIGRIPCVDEASNGLRSKIDVDVNELDRLIMMDAD